MPVQKKKKNSRNLLMHHVITAPGNLFVLYGFKYSYPIQKIYAQLYGFKYSYLIQIICTYLEILLSFLLRCGTRPYERGSNSLV